MNCLKVEEQFSAYLEDELDYQAVRAFDAHLSVCESCRREFTLFRESLDLLHQLPQIEPSTEFDIALQARLADTQVESIPFWQRVFQALHGQTRLALSAIAVLLVMAAGFYFYRKTVTKPPTVEIAVDPEPSKHTPLAEERGDEQQFPLAVPSQEPQSLVNFPESSELDLQPVRRSQPPQSPMSNLQQLRGSQQSQLPVFDQQPARKDQQPQRLEQNYILRTIKHTEAPTGGGL